ncbi:unnamed protein product [Cuscuta europaea]|uniref:Peptidase A2 domain-containing protein n=1 Tax=Cuscuta europaea TaxID=41803 RepID=A0A9P1DY44_CUSEU|nr:unnamed protein product [Cuscuta europaea]
MTDDTAITLFTNALRTRELYKELKKNPGTVYAEVLDRAHKHAALEEEIMIRDKVIAPAAPIRMADRLGPRPTAALPPKQGRFTPLVLSIATIYQHERDNIPIPTDSGQFMGVDDNAFSKYHNRKGHATNACRALQTAIEDLIRRGQLGKYVNKDPNAMGTLKPARKPNSWCRDAQRDAQPQNDVYVPPRDEPEGSGGPGKKPRMEVKVIFGGGETGDSNAERKRFERSLYVGSVSTPPQKKGKTDPITFGPADLPNSPSPHRDELVVSMCIDNALIRRVLVDTGSSVNVLYLQSFEKMGLQRSQLTHLRTPLASFAGNCIEAEGTIQLMVEIGDETHKASLRMTFVVVDIKCAHNAILGRPGLEDLEAIASVRHSCIKFPTDTRVGVARTDPTTARTCYREALKQMNTRGMRVNTIEVETHRTEFEAHPEPATLLEQIDLNFPPNRKVAIGVDLEADIQDDVQIQSTPYMKNEK